MGVTRGVGEWRKLNFISEINAKQELCNTIATCSIIDQVEGC